MRAMWGTHFPPIKPALREAGRHKPARTFHFNLNMQRQPQHHTQTPLQGTKNKKKILMPKIPIEGLAGD